MTNLVLALDLGGSKTQALVAPSTGSAPPTEILAGCANLYSVGDAEVTRQLNSILEQIAVQDIRLVCAGAAGADTPGLADRLTALIHALVPQARIKVVHDSELILAAANLHTGIAVIAGTGSVVWGRSLDGSTARAGGWGFLLGDEGSGYWVGRQAVRHALSGLDRGRPADRLSQQLAADCGLQHPGELLEHFYSHPERRYWAGRSRMVFELAAGGDVAAVAIVDDAAAALVSLIRTVATRLPEPRLPVVLGGGLLVHQPTLARALTASLHRRGHDDVRVLTTDPVHGALLLARHLATVSP